MEKLKPSHDLEAFQTAFALHRAMSVAAFRDAQSLGFIRRADVAKLVQKLHRDDFVKSVTSFDNHRQWQDVYNIEHEGAVLYLKFTDHVLTEFILLSFKWR